MADAAVELLLLGTRHNPTPDTQRRIRDLLLNGVDGPRLLELAHSHGVVPLLARTLNQAWSSETAGAPPPQTGEITDLIDDLQASAGRIARENLRLTGALLELTTRLEAAGVKAVAYKGPTLSLLLYGDPALRTFDDLDFLVAPGQVTRATEVLTDIGFEGWEDFTVGEAQRLDGSRYARHFGHPERQLAVDLHWDLADPAWGFRTSELLDALSAETIRLGGGEFRTLPIPALLLALCVHGSKHEPLPWHQLKWAVDVAGLMEFVPDWEATMKQARRFRVERATLLGLLCAHELVGVPLAPPVRQALSDNPGIRDAWTLIQPRMFMPPHDGSRDELPTRQRLSLDLSLVDRRVDRVRFIVRRLLTPTPKDWEVVRLPSRLSVGYYLIRPVRLLVSKLLRVRRSGSSSEPG